MALYPFDRLQNWLKFRSRVREEVGFLIERHGANAAQAALDEVRTSTLSPRRVKLLRAAAQRLKR